MKTILCKQASYDTETDADRAEREMRSGKLTVGRNRKNTARETSALCRAITDGAHSSDMEVVQDETGPGLPEEGAMGSVKEAQCLLELMSSEK